MMPLLAGQSVEFGLVRAVIRRSFEAIGRRQQMLAIRAALANSAANCALSQLPSSCSGVFSQNLISLNTQLVHHPCGARGTSGNIT